MLTGRCLCGGVRFQIDAPLGPVVYCHCSMCRRATGSTFATNASVRADKVRIIAGQELIKEYNSSPGNYRRFCSNCGSPLFGRIPEDPSVLRVRLGSLDHDPGSRPVAHIWTASKSAWFEICDSLERYEHEAPLSYCLPG
jgi:hypothetical protein